MASCACAGSALVDSLSVAGGVGPVWPRSRGTSVAATACTFAGGSHHGTAPSSALAFSSLQSSGLPRGLRGRSSSPLALGRRGRSAGSVPRIGFISFGVTWRTPAVTVASLVSVDGEDGVGVPAMRVWPARVVGRYRIDDLVSELPAPWRDHLVGRTRTSEHQSRQRARSGQLLCRPVTGVPCTTARPVAASAYHPFRHVRCFSRLVAEPCALCVENQRPERPGARGQVSPHDRSPIGPSFLPGFHA